ncbi:amphi-Trp domain-containing protein [Bacillus sp. B15-48]|uniref:amphi-Trp domain-containing protein n=1 Tax=Bacillus sp. B15-48 TaxID=1548601 RepID=UPI00193EC4F3|nr:amphi-Trp domain-containing protein [Bacillus sp. B15-48]MBM4761228.1 amphi-Trp domain-containing protein [Bacillus sp. B15-48]
MEERNKPVTEVLLKHKEQQSTVEFATMLEKIAEKLKTEGQFTFVQGEEQILVQPASQVKVEYKYTQRGDKHSFEIEFDWYTGESQQKSMGIE